MIRPQGLGLACALCHRQNYNVLRSAHASAFCRAVLWMFRLSSWFLIVICCAPAWAGTAVPHYVMHVWQTDEGLPQNAVSAIVQTRDGYLWAGTYAGLARFDGVRFAVFDNNNTPAMFSSRVTSLFEDALGTLWIGYETGELVCGKAGIFRNVDIPAWNGKEILWIGQDGAGEIWILGVDGSLLRVRGGLVLQSKEGVNTEIGSITTDRFGHTWVRWGGRISLLDGDHLSPAPFARDYIYVQGVCLSRDGELWLADDGRLRRWKESGWGEDLGMAAWGTVPTMSSLVEMRAGGLAAGTVTNGVYFMLPDRTLMCINRTNGLPSDRVRCLCEDREANLWIGTENGLVMLRAGNTTPVYPPDRWQDQSILSVSKAPDDTLWIATEGAGLYRMKQADWTHFGMAQGISSLFVWSVSEDPQGHVWAGTWDSGLFVQSGDRFERVTAFDRDTTPVFALLHATDGSTWVGTQTGLAHLEQGKAEWYGTNAGLVHPDVHAIAQDHEGAIWFGMASGGLGVIQHGVARQFRKASGLASDFIQCLHLDDNDSLWIGTAGGGLNRLKKDQFAVINASQGLANNVICDIEDDGKGNFWFSSHGGIFYVNKNQLDACADGLTNSVQAVVYDKSDGLPTLECSGGFQPAGCMTADGRMWFPTTKGLVVVDAKARDLNRLPPPVVIEDLMVNEQPIVKGGFGGAVIRIPPGRNRLEFRYTGLSLAAPGKVKFKYRLEGLESQWIEAGTKRTANYSYISPGHYTFHVIACNNDGIWNETGATLAIIALPYFWQTWWFRLLAVLGLAAAVGGGVLMETQRRMRRKLAWIEREHAVERERARIARDIHDELGASLTRITMLSQPAGTDQDPGKSAGEMDQIRDTALGLTRAMDEVVWAVNPKHDTLDSLAAYLATYAQDFVAAARVRCRLEIPLRLPPWPLTSETRHNVFLAFKEALNNAVKHGSPSEVRISLMIEPGAFSLQIEDTGCGFSIESAESVRRSNPDRPASGHGLENMRQRLMEIGGRCDIRSAPGEGTAVRLIVPNQAPVS
jgi:signal transduction histidine kinase/ligand-binding sensor domain-containing protein